MEDLGGLNKVDYDNMDWTRLVQIIGHRRNVVPHKRWKIIWLWVIDRSWRRTQLSIAISVSFMEVSGVESRHTKEGEKMISIFVVITLQVSENVLKSKQNCKILKLFSYHHAAFPKISLNLKYHSLMFKALV